MIKNKKIDIGLLVFIVSLLLCIIVSTFYFLKDTINFATANLQIKNISIEDATVVNLQVVKSEENSAVLYSETNDPQIIINCDDTQFINLQLTLEFDRAPDEVILFYANSDEEFSAYNKVWAKQTNNNTYYFNLQGLNFDKVRIDATNLIASEFTIENIVANIDKPFWHYYVPTKSQVFYFIMYTSIVAALFGYIAKEYKSVICNILNKVKQNNQK